MTTTLGHLVSVMEGVLKTRKQLAPTSSSSHWTMVFDAIEKKKAIAADQQQLHLHHIFSDFVVHDVTIFGVEVLKLILAMTTGHDDEALRRNVSALAELYCPHVESMLSSVPASDDMQFALQFFLPIAPDRAKSVRMPQKYTNQAHFFRFLSPIHVVIMSLYVDLYERRQKVLDKGSAAISLSSLQSVMFRTCAGFSQVKDDAAFFDLLKFTITNYCSLMLDQEATISSTCKDRFMSGIDLTTFSATESQRDAGARLAARLARSLEEKSKKRRAAPTAAAATTSSTSSSTSAKKVKPEQASAEAHAAKGLTAVPVAGPVAAAAAAKEEADYDDSSDDDCYIFD